MSDMKELAKIFQNNQQGDDWTEKILEQLADNEVAKDGEKKFPRVRGLRRIGRVLAPATSINSSVIGYPNKDYAAVKTTLKLPVVNGFVEYDAVAEATPENIGNDLISQHLLATAESRSEGRAWTKLLLLNCLTAEEMSLSNKDKVDQEVIVDIDELPEFITDTQKKMINSKCKKLKVNPLKYIEAVANNNDLKLNKGRISFDLALKVQKSLDELNRKEDKEIPEDLQGYVQLD